MRGEIIWNSVFAVELRTEMYLRCGAAGNMLKKE